jgi:hypothetical protein
MLHLLDESAQDQCFYCTSKKSLLNDVDSDEEDDEGVRQDILGYMTTCYHLVCPNHVKKIREEWKHLIQPDGLVRCHICDDRNKPALIALNRGEYRAYQDERERMRKDPKLAKKVGSYTGPHTKTLALLHDLDEFRTWSEQHPDERPIKRYVLQYLPYFSHVY